MIRLDRPIDLLSDEFVNDKYTWYERIREERPVCQVKISVMKMYAVSRYEDCTAILKDARIVRNRSRARGGGGRLPFPMPAAVKPLVESMILEDDPGHRRLRELVRRAFRPQAIGLLEQRIEAYSIELLDKLDAAPRFDLQADYALAIPTRMIADMLGIPQHQMPRFAHSMSVLTKGFSGLRLLRTLLWDMRASVGFVRELIADKRRHPGEDILTGLIEAEQDGDRLSEDELLAMVFLLIVAGYETTVHLITNIVHTLFVHPEQLARLRADMTLIDSAVEEVLRHRGPIQGTKPGYLSEDIELHGVRMKRGSAILPLFGAANHDPRVFDDPQRFDIGRTPNHHLGFGHGIHFCLGAHLARAEARIAVRNLLERMPDLALADPDRVRFQKLPLWHRFDGLPVMRREVSRAAA